MVEDELVFCVVLEITPTLPERRGRELSPLAAGCRQKRHQGPGFPRGEAICRRFKGYCPQMNAESCSPHEPMALMY